MLEKLTLRHFQCHERITVKFDERITTIVGKSDIGKSAILRALRLLCTNQPSGDSYIQHGQDACSVSLVVDDHKIVRKRGKGVNTYSFDGQTYKAFGSSVPDAVAKLLNVSEVNFANQHASPYWFLLSAPQVSRELNTLVDLDVIDFTLANVASEVRKAKATVEVSRERLKQAKEEREQLRYVDKIDKDLRQIECVQNDIVQNEADRAFLASTIHEAESVQERLETLSAMSLDQFSTGEIGQIDEELQRVNLECLSLSKIVDECTVTEERIEEAERELIRLEEELRGGIGEQCPLCNQVIL